MKQLDLQEEHQGSQMEGEYVNNGQGSQKKNADKNYVDNGQASETENMDEICFDFGQKYQKWRMLMKNMF